MMILLIGWITVVQRFEVSVINFFHQFFAAVFAVVCTVELLMRSIEISTNENVLELAVKHLIKI